MHRKAPDLDTQLDRAQQALPGFAARCLAWLRKPSLVWLRVPVGLLLIIASLLWFLPVLGLWMFPLGLVLVALDVPFLRRPVARLIAWGERKWAQWTGRGGNGARRRESLRS
jgi:hypothetical protein